MPVYSNVTLVSSPLVYARSGVTFVSSGAFIGSNVVPVAPPVSIGSNVIVVTLPPEPIYTRSNVTFVTPTPLAYVGSRVTFVTPRLSLVRNVIRYVGKNNVPRNIRQQRGSNLDTMRRFGTPVLIKHRFNADDVQKGIAEKSPNFSATYGQTRRDDPISWGVGFVSVEKSDDEWVTPEGRLVVSATNPGGGAIPAPKYRGWGPGYLTYAILPDVSEDIYKLTPTGVLIRTQQATVQMGWYPEVKDNDLLVIVQIDQSENIIACRERFLLKMTSPASMRGLDRKGRIEYGEDFGNRHVTDQSFQMTLLPENDVAYNVEIDR